MKKVTIVCVTYNHEKFIKKALHGFLMQKTNFDYDIIVSDDASTDKTQEIITTYAKENKKIIPILRDKNVGSNSNYLSALQKVQSEYLAICDGDDYWTDEYKLQKQVDYMEKNKELSLSFHKTLIIDDNIQKVYPNNQNNFNIETLLKENFIPSNSVMYRVKNTTILKNISDDIVPLDYYIHLQFAKIGKIGFIDEVMSCYVRHKNAMWIFNKSHKKNIEYFSKYGFNSYNFFLEIENEFKLDNKFYFDKKKYILENTIWNLIEQQDFEKINIIKQHDHELLKNVISDISPKYLYSSRWKKFIYYLLFDKTKLKQKLFKEN